MNKKIRSNLQLERLPEQIRAVEESNAAYELHEFINRIRSHRCKDDVPLNIMIVGDGDNYPAALFSKFSIKEKYDTINVQTFTTQYALSYLKQCDNYNYCDFKPKYDLIIAIAFDGTSEEIKKIAKLCIKRDFYFTLLTYSPELVLNKDVFFYSNKINVVSYFTPAIIEPVPYTLSFIATLAPILLFDDDEYKNYIKLNMAELEKGKAFVESLDIKNIAQKLAVSPIIHVFYERPTEPTAYDIKHKFTASGIANVILHEKGDFSNGDANILLKHNFGFVINLIKHGYDSDYNETFNTFLENFCKANKHEYLNIGSNCCDNTQWNIETMTMLPYLITAIGNELNIDVVNPEKQITKEEILK